MMRMRAVWMSPAAVVGASTVVPSDMQCFPCCGEFKAEGGAVSNSAIYLDASRMLLDDAVCHREAKSGAAALTVGRSILGGEEGVVDALHMLRSDSRAGIRNEDADAAIHLGCHAERAAGGHGVLGIDEEVQEDLLQFVRIAYDAR